MLHYLSRSIFFSYKEKYLLLCLAKVVVFHSFEQISPFFIKFDLLFCIFFQYILTFLNKIAVKYLVLLQYIGSNHLSYIYFST